MNYSIQKDGTKETSPITAVVPHSYLFMH